MLRGGATTGVPTLPFDLYGREALVNPAETYRRIREAGAVVWLPKNRLWVMGRYRDVRQALGDDQNVRERQRCRRQSTHQCADGRHHPRQRRRSSCQTAPATVCNPFRPKRSATVDEPLLQIEASALIDSLCHRDEFDGVSEFAAHLPVRVVADLVGVDIDHNRMRKYGCAGIRRIGPGEPANIDGNAGRVEFLVLRAVHPRGQRQVRRVGGVAPRGGAGRRTEPSGSQGHGARLHRPQPGHHDPGVGATALQPRYQPARYGKSFAVIPISCRRLWSKRRASARRCAVSRE